MVLIVIILLQLPVVTVKISPDPSGSFVLITLGPYSTGAAAYRLENFSRKEAINFRQRLGQVTTPYLTVPLSPPLYLT